MNYLETYFQKVVKEKHVLGAEGTLEPLQLLGHVAMGTGAVFLQRVSAEGASEGASARGLDHHEMVLEDPPELKKAERRGGAKKKTEEGEGVLPA